MKKNRNNILILVSNEQNLVFAESLKQEIESYGKHYVLIVEENKIKNNFLSSFLAKQFWLNSNVAKFGKMTKKEREEKKPKLHSDMRKLKNAVKRFNPTAIICTDARLERLCVATKLKTNFKSKIVAFMPSFVRDEKFVENAVEMFLVENEEVKNSLVEKGYDENHIFSCGMPIKIDKINQEEKNEEKKNFGLSRIPLICLSMQNRQNNKRIFDLLADQGDILNVAVCSNDQELLNDVKAIAEEKAFENLMISEDKKDFDEILKASDILISDYNLPLIQKAFHLELSNIVFDDNKQNFENLNFLKQKGLIAHASNEHSAIKFLYDIIQTDLKTKLEKNSAEKVGEKNQLSTIGKLLAEIDDMKEAKDEE